VYSEPNYPFIKEFWIWILNFKLWV
jgi:hypothetical protein